MSARVTVHKAPGGWYTTRPGYGFRPMPRHTAHQTWEEAMADATSIPRTTAGGHALLERGYVYSRGVRA